MPPATSTPGFWAQSQSRPVFVAQWIVEASKKGTPRVDRHRGRWRILHKARSFETEDPALLVAYVLSGNAGPHLHAAAKQAEDYWTRIRGVRSK